MLQETLLQGVSLNIVNLGRRLMRYKDKVCNGYKLQLHRLPGRNNAFSLVKVSPPRKETLPTDFTQYPTPKVEAQAPIQQAQALASVQVNPLQAILKVCGYKEDTDKKQACNFLQTGNNCGLSSDRCEADFIYQIQEPVKQEPVKQEPVEEEALLFNVPSIDPLTRVFTEQLKLRLSTLLKELKTPAEIVDILIKENFPVDKNKWTSIKVNKAIEFFGLSKEKKSGAELKLEKRGVYDHRWLQGFPTTRVSKEVYLSQYAEGVPMGGVTCDANSTKKSIKFDASDLIKSVLGVSSVKDALAKATTPEQREQASKEKYGDKE